MIDEGSRMNRVGTGITAPFGNGRRHTNDRDHAAFLQQKRGTGIAVGTVAIGKQDAIIDQAGQKITTVVQGEQKGPVHAVTGSQQMELAISGLLAVWGGQSSYRQGFEWKRLLQTQYGPVLGNEGNRWSGLAWKKTGGVIDG